MLYVSMDGKSLVEVSDTPFLDFLRRKNMSIFQKEAPYKAPEYQPVKQFTEQVNAPGSLGVEVYEEPTKEILTIPLAPISIDSLFAKQDGLRLRFTNLKKFIVREIPKSDEKVAGLVKLDEALASLVVGLTKEMK